MKKSTGPGRAALRLSAGALPLRALARRAPAAAWAAAAALLAGCGQPPAGAQGSAAAPAEPIAPCPECSVLLVSIDTLRADRLGAYGSPRDPSPSPGLDRLAAGGVLFERAQSASYHTADSHMSMMTSLFPAAHLVRNAAAGGGRRLDDGVATLAELLRAAGFRTAGFHGGGNVGPMYGFDRGFERYRRARDPRVAAEWLAEHGGERVFVFFHTYHTHDPYTPEPPFDALYDPGYDGPIVHDEAALIAEAARIAEGDGGFRELRDAFWSRVDADDPRAIEHLLALYDGEIAEVDRDLAPLFAAAAAAPRPVFVIVVSDHGEEFHEHGKFLHDQLYQELLHVPLILAGPGLPAGRRVAPPVSLVDLAPTVLDLVGLEPPAQFQGRSLLPAIAGSGEPGTVFSEKVRQGALERGDESGRLSAWALVEGDRKLLTKTRPELYDLAADPGEERPLAEPAAIEELARRARRVQQESRERRRSLGVPLRAETEALDAETREELKALGYLK